MTDWLTPDERAANVAPHVLDVWKSLHLFNRHAAEADRRLAERDDVIRELADALRGHLDDEECSFDHNGCCQMHGDFSIGKHGRDGRCYMVEHRALVARYDAMVGDA